MATKRKSHTELILEIIHKLDTPVQADRILIEMGRKPSNRSKASSIKTNLSNLTKLGVLVKVKYPKISCFYCKPEWVDKQGNIKKELNFSPYWKS